MLSDLFTGEIDLGDSPRFESARAVWSAFKSQANKRRRSRVYNDAREFQRKGSRGETRHREVSLKPLNRMKLDLLRSRQVGGETLGGRNERR